MIKNILLLLIFLALAIPAGLWFFNTRKVQPPQPHSGELYEMHDELVQTRILLVEVLTANEHAKYELGELFSYLEAQSAQAMSKANDLSKLFENTSLVLGNINTFATAAKKTNTANRDKALTLLTDLTNLILEYRFELQQLGFQFPPLPSPWSP